MIQDYFGDGSRFGISIQYLWEEKKLGTAGALSLLPHMESQHVIVMNGDLLTTVDYRNLFNYHISHNVEATICVREYDFTVPYGVVNTTDGLITSIEEKPVHRFFINAGIYVLSESLLKKLQFNEYCDITTLLQNAMNEDIKLASFPLREYWMDIGRLEDYVIADKEYNEVFA
jgi:NDP-sugar pyrophosphorylase family protein